jgi:cytochrome c oxidase subunit IV
MVMQAPQHHTGEHHYQPSHVRRVGGWGLIALGIAGIILPALPGVIFIVLGIVLLSPRDPLLRRLAFSIRLFLRRWCRVRNQRLSRLGWWVRLRHRAVRLAVREQAARARRGDYRRRYYVAWAALFVLSMMAYAGAAFAIRMGMVHWAQL